MVSVVSQLLQLLVVGSRARLQVFDKLLLSLHFLFRGHNRHYVLLLPVQLLFYVCLHLIVLLWEHFFEFMLHLFFHLVYIDDLIHGLRCVDGAVFSLSGCLQINLLGFRCNSLTTWQNKIPSLLCHLLDCTKTRCALLRRGYLLNSAGNVIGLCLFHKWLTFFKLITFFLLKSQRRVIKFLKNCDCFFRGLGVQVLKLWTRLNLAQTILLLLILF
jgi:hypothetical protein